MTADVSFAPNGTLRLDFVDNGSVYDRNWNAIGGEGRGNGNYTSGQSDLIDKGDPLPVITSEIPAPTLPSSVTEFGVATRTVNDQPLIVIVNHPQSATIAAGASHMFTVVAAGGAGTLAYSWWFDEGVGHLPLQEGGNVPQLTITDASHRDTGGYWVEISDHLNTVVSDMAVVHVLEDAQLPAAEVVALIVLSLAAIVLLVFRREQKSATVKQ